MCGKSYMSFNVFRNVFQRLSARAAGSCRGGQRLGGDWAAAPPGSGGHLRQPSADRRPAARQASGVSSDWAAIGRRLGGGAARQRRPLAAPIGGPATGRGGQRLGNDSLAIGRRLGSGGAARRALFAQHQSGRATKTLKVGRASHGACQDNGLHC